MIDTTDAPDAPIPCPTCARPILLDELRCRACGTRLEEYSADAPELDFSDDEEIPETPIVVIGTWVGFGLIVTTVLLIDAFVCVGVYSALADANSPADRALVLVFGLLAAAWLIGTTRVLYRKACHMVREGARS